MTTSEWKATSKRVRYALEVAQRRILEQKATRNEKMVVSTPDGKFETVSARRMLKEVKAAEQ
jgi:hypothetical protein